MPPASTAKRPSPRAAVCPMAAFGTIPTSAFLMPLEQDRTVLKARLALYHEPALSGRPTVMGKAQKEEGLRSSLAPARPVRRSEPAELDQAGLAFMKAESELGETFAQGLQQSLCVASIFAEQDVIIGESNETDVPSRLPPLPLLYPLIEAVVQIDVGEDRADPRPLRSSGLRRHMHTVFQNAGPQPQADEPEDTRVADPMRDHPFHPGVINAPEEVSDVRVDDPVHPLRYDGCVHGASYALRLGRKPNEQSRKSAS
jgi:hypothetical protein